MENLDRGMREGEGRREEERSSGEKG